MPNNKILWWKTIAIWIMFLLLHFSYETYPNIFFKIIGEEGETIYFHMKMLFFAYLIISTGEYFIRRKTIVSVEQFVYSRMLIAVTYPWLTITMWFTAMALGIHLPLYPWELIYANIITVVGVYFSIRLEEVLDPVQFRPALKGLIALVFVTALLSYISFSFNTPMEFFTQPAEF